MKTPHIATGPNAPCGRHSPSTRLRPLIGARLTRWLLPVALLLLITLGCSAADLVQRRRATPTPLPQPAGVLLPTFTPTPIAMQTLIVVTPPSEGQPGVIIVPPGMNPESVIPELPTATPTPPPDMAPGALLTPDAVTSPLQPGSPHPSPPKGAPRTTTPAFPPPPLGDNQRLDRLRA